MPLNDHQQPAAGIVFRSKAGEILLMMRTATAPEYPNHWGLPGGHAEENESLEDCARREAFEETGFKFKGDLRKIHQVGDFTYYLADWNDDAFPVTICDESSGFMWATPATLPDPLIPGMTDAFRIMAVDTELAVAELMRDGVLSSPQVYGNVTLFDLRVTGTGTAFRSKDNEHVYRPPEHYLNDEFLARCNGLPVIWVHPEKALLTSEEFSNRIIGSVFVPYIKGDEVWGISKIYDQTAIAEMVGQQLSTSPGVALDVKGDNDSVILTLDNKEKLLIEGKPFLLDHLAVCNRGVWDKGGNPAGVGLTNQEVIMTQAEIEAKAKADAEAKAKADADALAAKAKADADDDKTDKILAAVDSMGKRFDAMEKRMDAIDPAMTADDKARKDADDKEKSEAEAKAKADAEEDEKMKEKAKADADEKARCDAEAPQYSQFQAQAETVYHAFADAAPRQLQGERLLPYRRRLLEPFKKHSADFKDVDLNQINDSAMMAIAEKRILADAATVARHPVDVPAGILREIKTPDGTGRVISTFYGDPSACWAPFRLPSRRLTSINKDF